MGIKVKVRGLKRNNMKRKLNTIYNLYRLVFYGIGIGIGFIISPVTIIVDAIILTTKNIFDVQRDLFD